MKRLKIFAVLIAFMTVWTAKADEVLIPTATGTYIDWSLGTVENANVENNGTNIGSTGEKTKVVFNLKSEKAGKYMLTIATGHKGHAFMDLVLTDAEGNTVLTGVHEIMNTGSWTPSTESKFYTPELPAGSYVLTMTPRDLTGSNYAGNWGKLALYDASVDNTEHIPGVVHTSRASMIGGARDEGQNIGYIKDGCGSSNEITVDEPGVYSMTLDMARYGDGVLTVSVNDAVTGALEGETKWPLPETWAGYAPQTINIEGELTKGHKILKVVFNANHGGFIANYKDMTFAKIADKCAVFRGVTIDGQDVTVGEGYDWNVNLPLAYGETTVIKPIVNSNAIVTASAVNGDGNEVEVVKNADGTFSLPTPAGSTATVVTFNVAAEEGVLVFRDSYTLRLYHIGDIILTSLVIDDTEAPAELLDALNVKGETAEASLNDWIFTASPVIVGTFADNSKVTADIALDGDKATATFKGEAGSKTKAYTINLSGFHIYSATEGDEAVKIAYDPSLNQADGSWSNGSYTINPVNDGWSGTQFKFKNNTEITFSVPSNVVIKQIKFARLKDNYNPGTIGYVRSEGATVYCPTSTAFKVGDGAEKDVYVNFEGHKAGTPVTFLFTPGSQPVAWFELLVEKLQLTTAPEVTASSATATDYVNHAVFSFSFDREMASAIATVNGDTKVEGEVAGATVRFKVWDLPWDATAEVKILRGDAKDIFGNVTTGDFYRKTVVGKQPAVPAIQPIVVSNVDEWKAALQSVAETNANADATRAVIFVRNGSYDFGTEEQNLGHTYNVSVIGESREGVILHGTRSGISSPVISTRQANGTFFQDLTMRNDLDFGKDKRSGVGVALYGGTKDMLVNVALQSIQDTYVTGNQSYLKNCHIHGNVDYICGGGNHYFDTCYIHHDFAEGGYITAPATSANDKYGYVFQANVIDGFDNYALGRPWQQEPSAYFLNTRMVAKASDAGWGAMATLPTHFYEFNSVDAEGNAIDLSTRQNSPTSTNSYVPVLSADEAARFTARNVLCGPDSWDPSFDTKAVEAPANAMLENGVITWDAVNGASAYAVFLNGGYVAHVTDTKFAVEEPKADDVYTVKAANAMGGLGTPAAVKDLTSGIGSIAAEDEVEAVYYNLQGVRVANPANGLYIRVAGDKAEKVIVK